MDWYLEHSAFAFQLPFVFSVQIEHLSVTMQLGFSSSRSLHPGLPVWSILEISNTKKSHPSLLATGPPTPDTSWLALAAGLPRLVKDPAGSQVRRYTCRPINHFNKAEKKCLDRIITGVRRPQIQDCFLFLWGHSILFIDCCRNAKGI